jgi:Fic family protein
MKRKDKKNIREEVNDLLSATEVMLKYFKKRKKLFIPRSFFLMIHKEALRHKPNYAGRYRKPTDKIKIDATFIPCKSWEVEHKIIDLLDFINNKKKWSYKFEKYFIKTSGHKNFSKKQRKILKIVFIAWYTHHQFVVIHPFCDGNGRVARMLMCLILAHNGFGRASFPPFLNTIINNKKEEYLDRLNEADSGNYVSGVMYMLDILSHSFNLTAETITKTIKN